MKNKTETYRRDGKDLTINEWSKILSKKIGDRVTPETLRSRAKSIGFRNAYDYYVKHGVNKIKKYNVEGVGVFTLAQLSKKYGVDKQTILYRIRKFGWSLSVLKPVKDRSWRKKIPKLVQIAYDRGVICPDNKKKAYISVCIKCPCECLNFF